MSRKPDPLPDPELYVQLTCDLLRQMAWLGAAAAGGLLVLLESDIVPVDWISIAALVMLLLGIGAGMLLTGL